jgi:hypothetical protein
VSAARIPYLFELEDEDLDPSALARGLNLRRAHLRARRHFTGRWYTAGGGAAVAGLAPPAAGPPRVGSLAALFAIVRARTGRVDAAVVAACLFAATYRLSGTWFEIARVDALFLFLFLAAAWLLLGRDSAPAAVAAGALLGLSYLTKQTALVPAAPLVLWLFVERWLGTGRRRHRGVTGGGFSSSTARQRRLILVLHRHPRRRRCGDSDLRDLLAFWHRDPPLPAGPPLLLGARACTTGRRGCCCRWP